MEEMTYKMKRVMRFSGNVESMNVILFDKAAQNTLDDIQAGDLI